MKIRSITVFIHPTFPLTKCTSLQQVGKFLPVARSAFEDAGYEVQSCRLATTPFGQYITPLTGSTAVRVAREISEAAKSFGVSYTALGPAQPTDLKSFDVIPEVLAETGDVFMSAEIASRSKGFSLPAIQACGNIIQRLSTFDPNGFTNLYFCASANVEPNAPFFPAAFHAGDQPAFALALEAADLVVDAFSQAGSLEEARRRLVTAVEEQAAALTAIALRLQDSKALLFKGMDFSPAPYPEKNISLGSALELLGVPALGLHGSLAAAAFLADALDRAQYHRTGFNGLMLPVLEDATLAERGAGGTLEVKDLLLFSAVCGTGLDTVPLPGDVSPQALSAVLLDLAALAQRLDKPLTARLMPVPGKVAGDLTHFDFSYFANSRVLKLNAAPLGGLFSAAETVILKPRTKPTEAAL